MTKWFQALWRRSRRVEQPAKKTGAAERQRHSATWIGMLKELPIPSDPTALRPADLARFLLNEASIFPNLWNRLFGAVERNEFWHAGRKTPNVTGDAIRDSGMWDQARIMREKQEEVTRLRESIETESILNAKQTAVVVAKIRSAQAHSALFRQQHASAERIRQAEQKIRVHQKELDRIPDEAFQRNMAIETMVRAKLDEIQSLENQIAASKKKARAYLIPAIQELNKKKPGGKTRLLYHSFTPARALGEFLEEEAFFSSKRMIVLRNKLHEVRSGKRTSLFYPDKDIPRITNDFKTDRQIAHSAITIFSLRNKIRESMAKAAQPSQTPEQQERLLEIARKMEERINGHKYFVRLQLLAHYQNGR